MSSKLLQFLKSGPPPARVALLPDHRFFVRTVPVAAGTAPVEVPAQIELALEGLSPFPPAQLYYGFHWLPGSAHALVFGCYRKRFTTDQHATWAEAVLVAPAFAAFLAVPHEPATTLIFPSAEGLTAIHWEDGAVPVRVVCAAVPAEADEATRTRIHADLLRAAGASRKVIDVSAPPVAASSPDEKQYAFTAGTFTATLPVGVAQTLDVRDRDELTAWRKKVRNDLWLWRATAGSVAAMLMIGILQLAMVFLGDRWDKSLNLTINRNRPLVAEIETKEEIAKTVEERLNKLFLPLEGMTAIWALPQRGSIVFNRSVANAEQNPYVITLGCQTPNSQDVEAFRTAVGNLPTVERAEVSKNSTASGRTSFDLTVTFKPDALKAAVAATVATNK
jgi:hypothetical protein